MTFADEIEEAAEGEPIEAVSVGQSFHAEYADIPLGQPLPWEVARPLLTRDFVDGYPPICAWSKSWVIFVHEYDGDLSIRSVPRNPTKHHPHYNG